MPRIGLQSLYKCNSPPKALSFESLNFSIDVRKLEKSHKTELLPGKKLGIEGVLSGTSLNNALEATSEMYLA